MSRFFWTLFILFQYVVFLPTPQAFAEKAYEPVRICATEMGDIATQLQELKYELASDQTLAGLPLLAGDSHILFARRNLNPEIEGGELCIFFCETNETKLLMGLAQTTPLALKGEPYEGNPLFFTIAAGGWYNMNLHNLPGYSSTEGMRFHDAQSDQTYSLTPHLLLLSRDERFLIANYLGRGLEVFSTQGFRRLYNIESDIQESYRLSEAGQRDPSTYARDVALSYFSADSEFVISLFGSQVGYVHSAKRGDLVATFEVGWQPEVEIEAGVLIEQDTSVPFFQNGEGHNQLIVLSRLANVYEGQAGSSLSRNFLGHQPLASSELPDPQVYYYFDVMEPRMDQLMERDSPSQEAQELEHPRILNRIKVAGSRKMMPPIDFLAKDLIATGEMNGEIRIYSANAPSLVDDQGVSTPVAILQGGHASSISSLDTRHFIWSEEYGGDGRSYILVASGSIDGRVSLWLMGVEDGAVVDLNGITTRGFDMPIRDLDLSAHGARLIVSTDHEYDENAPERRRIVNVYELLQLMPNDPISFP